MSTNEEKLYTKIMNDRPAQAEVMQGATEDERIDAIVRLGEKYDMPVTREAAREYLAANAEEELSDTQLEAVVGGKGSDSESFYRQNGSLLFLGDDGDDNVTGTDKNDVLMGHGGNDSMVGGAGNDIMLGGEGNDTLEGGTGDDKISGNEGNDDLYGGDGNDTINGGEGNDALLGGAGNDVLDGGSGNDVLFGGSGNDKLTGGEGNDSLAGGSGDDTINGGSGDDLMHGGAGNDVFVFGNNDGNDIIKDFNPAEDKLQFEGASADDISVSTEGGNTTVTFGDTSVVLEGVEMSHAQVMAAMESDGSNGNDGVQVNVDASLW